MKDWNMKDFDKPEGKGVLKAKKQTKPKKDQSCIIVYMTKNEELSLRQEAQEMGVSAAGLIRFKLKQLKKMEK